MRRTTTFSELRSDSHARVSAVGFGILVGALLGSVHWVGIFVGGAIAGLAQRSFPRGIGAGALAGVGIWLVFIATMQVHGAAVPALGSMPIIAVSLVIAVGYGAAGGLLRGVR